MEITSGIILRVIPFKEKDAMITVISKDGYHGFYARNVFNLKGKNAPALQKYSEVELSLSEGPSGGLYLSQVHLLHSASYAMRSLIRMSALELITEAVLRAIREDEDAGRIYPYLQMAIQEISAEGEPLAQVIIMLAQILKVTGYGLNVDHCIYCNSPKEIVAIDYPLGGYICKSCFKGLSTSKTGVEILHISRFIFRLTPNDMKRANFNSAIALEIYHELKHALYEQLGITLQSDQLFQSSQRN